MKIYQQDISLDNSSSHTLTWKRILKQFLNSPNLQVLLTYDLRPSTTDNFILF
jgi:hypothetical protein